MCPGPTTFMENVLSDLSKKTIAIMLLRKHGSECSDRNDMSRVLRL